MNLYILININKLYTLGASHFSFSDDDIPLTVLALRTLGTFDFKGTITVIFHLNMHLLFFFMRTSR